METFELELHGYYDEPFVRIFAPSLPGIYCIYTCRIANDSMLPWKSLRPRKLLYIGQAKSLKERLTTGDESLQAAREAVASLKAASHDRYALGFSYAPASVLQLDRIEAALVYHHKPGKNRTGKDSFKFPATRIRITGTNGLLTEEFTVWNQRSGRNVLSLLNAREVSPKP